MKAGLYEVAAGCDVCLWSCRGNAHRWLKTGELVLSLGRKSTSNTDFELVFVDGEFGEVSPDPGRRFRRIVT